MPAAGGTERKHGTGWGQQEWEAGYLAHTLRADGFDASEDGTGRGTPLVAVSLTAGSAASEGVNPPGRRQEDDVNLVAFAQNQRNEVRDLNGVAGALAAEPGTHQRTYIVNAAESCAKQSHAREAEVARSLDTTGGFASCRAAR